MKPVADIVIHIPHSATFVPPDVRESLLLSDEALGREIQLMTDWYTDELFGGCDPAIEILRFPVSRLVVDPERFLDDDQEPMARVGMGAIYTRTSDGHALREPPGPVERAALLERYYVPHHRKMRAYVDAALQAYGYALVLDGHSFPSESLPCHEYQGKATPDICLGTDEFHTPRWLADLAVRVCKAAGYTVTENQPFPGAFVPLGHCRRSPAVHALMIEINRRCYMDERAGTRLATFDLSADKLRGALRALISEVRSRMGGPASP